jgi:hypothetical protein
LLALIGIIWSAVAARESGMIGLTGMDTITLHSLVYYKGDLDKVPPDDRLFFLMAGAISNDTQALNKLLAVIIGTPDHDNAIHKQANSAFATLALRMLTGRLNEAYKLVSKYSNKLIRPHYLDEMSDEAKEGFQKLHEYFGGKRSLILKVRDGMAFHSIPEHVEAAYARLEPKGDLGDYLGRSIGNTLYYTPEILHFETLMHLTGIHDAATAIETWVQDAQEQTSNFNSFIFGYVLVFAKRYLQDALDKLPDEAEIIPVEAFEALKLPYLSKFPSTDQDGPRES